MKVLIYGLPGSGKTRLATKLKEYLGKVVELHEDDNEDFSAEGFVRQGQQLKRKCDESTFKGKIAIAEFIAPFETLRTDFDADFIVFMNTITKSENADVDSVFEPGKDYDYKVTAKNDEDAIKLAWTLARQHCWNNKVPTAELLGTWQSWDSAHQALLDKALEQCPQVYLMIRDVPIDSKNPWTASQVMLRLREKLVNYCSRVKIAIVPNITVIEESK